MYRQLNASHISATASALQSRILERFPNSGLGQLGAEVSAVSREAIERLLWINKPHMLLRMAKAALLMAVLAVSGVSMSSLRASELYEVSTFIQVLEAGLSSLFFIGAAIIFLATWESRIKRTRALEAIHELRAMAHIVDMHQLTKAPEAIFLASRDTASSPKRTLSAFELNRYLDYCSELLSILGKISALYAQSLKDPVVLDAVDAIEDLTTRLSQKIWQKITLVDTMQSAARSQQPPVAGKEL